MTGIRKLVFCFIVFRFNFELVLCLAIGSVLAEDYCNNMRCGEKPHVACNSPVPDGVSFPTEKISFNNPKETLKHLKRLMKSVFYFNFHFLLRGFI